MSAVRRLRIPLWFWPVVVVALLAVVIPARQPARVTAFAPVGDVPAFHVLDAADLETLTLRGGPGGLATTREQLIGRVTRSALPDGEPIARDAVTARPVVQAEVDALVPLAFTARSTTAGSVATGSAASLLFAPVADAAGVRPVTVRALLVDADTAEDGSTTYLVGLVPADRARVLTVLARSRLLVAPADPVSQGPPAATTR